MIRSQCYLCIVTFHQRSQLRAYVSKINEQLFWFRGWRRVELLSLSLSKLVSSIASSRYVLKWSVVPQSEAVLCKLKSPASINDMFIFCIILFQQVRLIYKIRSLYEKYLTKSLDIKLIIRTPILIILLVFTFIFTGK